MRKGILLLSFVLLQNCFSQGEGWYWLNPLPTGNDIYRIKFVNNNTGYAVCASGTVIKTTNGGLNWAVLKISTAVTFTGLDFVNANTGTIVGSNGIVYRTSNGGLNWVNQSFNDTINFTAVDFIDANTGMAVTSYWAKSRIYKTTNGGVSWNLAVNTNSTWNSFIDVKYITPTKIFAAGESMLYISTDAGNTWDTSTASYFQTSGNLSIAAVNTNIIYISLARYVSPSYTYYVAKTTDGGTTWSTTATGTRWGFDAIAFVNSNTGIGVGRYSNVHRTTDGGLTWIKMPMPADSSSWYRTCTSLGVNRFYYAGEQGKLFRSVNSGGTFTKLTRSFTDENILSLSFINNTTGIVSGTNSAIFKTTNGGGTWTQQNCPGSEDIIKVKLLGPDTGFAVTNNGMIYRTYNGGGVWNVMFSDTAANNWKAADMADSKNIFVTGGSCWHAGARTTNGGISWDTLYLECNCTGPPTSGCTSIRGIFMADPTHIGMVGSTSPPHTSGLPISWASVDGEDFDIIYSGQPGEYGPGSISYADTLNAFYSGGYRARIRTFDGFRTFIDYGLVNNQGTSLQSVSLKSSDEALALYQNMIYKSNNGGQNWSVSGTTCTQLDEIAYYKFSYSAAWGNKGKLVANQNPDVLTGNLITPGVIPQSFNLYQNYPNPFNPVTKIKFDVSDQMKGIVRLVVFDVIGRQVEELINRDLNAGTYEVEWNAAKYSSGVYFYKIESGTYFQTRKMVLIK